MEKIGQTRKNSSYYCGVCCIISKDKSSLASLFYVVQVSHYCYVSEKKRNRFGCEMGCSLASSATSSLFRLQIYVLYTVESRSFDYR